nr:D598 [uncultured bacterium]
MREEILKQFFIGDVDAKVLAADLVGSMVAKGDMTKHPIENMSEDFQIWPQHLIRLCDAVLQGEIEPRYLQSIGFCIVASDCFEFDSDTSEGDLVGETAYDWSAPEINYPLTLANVEKFRQRLLTGENPFQIIDAS